MKAETRTWQPVRSVNEFVQVSPGKRLVAAVYEILEQMSLSHFAGSAVDDRYDLAAIVDKDVLSGSMLLTHGPIKLLPPLPVMLVDLAAMAVRSCPFATLSFFNSRIAQKWQSFSYRDAGRFLPEYLFERCDLIDLFNLRVFNRLVLNSFCFGINYTTAVTQR